MNPTRRANQPMERTYWERMGRAGQDGSLRRLAGTKGALPAGEAGDRRACPEGLITHVIRTGESLLTIAERYNITLNELLEYNPNINPYFYTTGQILCVPSELPPQCAGGALHTIAKGDTLSSIAERYGVTEGAIADANPGMDMTHLVVGRIICVPAPAPAPAPAPTEPEPPALPECPEGASARYVVREGDTPASLLTMFNVSYRALSAYNPDINLMELAVGMNLCVPVSGSRGACSTGLAAYQMTSGDTLSSLAQRHGITEAQLLAMNPTLTPQDFSCASCPVICVPA